jgi:hypothetical protein
MWTKHSNMPLTPETTFTSYNVPLSAILLWPPRNLDDPERRHGAVPFAFFLQIFTTLAVAGRIYGRITRKAGNFGADDVLIIVAWVYLYFRVRTRMGTNIMFRLLVPCSQVSRSMVRYAFDSLDSSY